MSADTGNGFKIKAEQLCKQHMPPMSGLAGATALLRTPSRFLVHAAHIGVGGGNRCGGLRRRALHIPRPASGGGACSLRRSSSPQRNRFPRFRRGPRWSARPTSPSPHRKSPAAQGRGALEIVLHCHVTLRRLRDARLPSVSGPERGRFAAFPFRALAPVHPRCSARLRAS